MAKELIKGESYTREDIEKAGLTLFKCLSAVLIYKKDDLIYQFNKNDKAGKFDFA